MTGLISRHIATIDGERQIHYRKAGNGSPIILLHQSPKSSEEYIPLIKELSSDYAVFAPDTPGNGLSDPLPMVNPSMNDFAENVVKFMDVLGIDKCPVYGFHTGGSCTLELSWKFPKRVTVGIVDGYVNMPEERVKEILDNYFTPLEINWSGSHLTWIWSRFREQIIFFPWYRKDKASRMTGYSLPPPEYQQNSVIEFLRAGKAYVGPYRAAFTQDNVNSIKEMRANCLVMSSKTDVLYDGLDRMPKPSTKITIARPNTPPDAISLMKQKIKEYPSPNKIIDDLETLPIKGRIWGQYLQVGGGSLYCKGNDEADGRPILFIHSSASSNRSMEKYMELLIGKRKVFCVDLPGNGESDNPMGEDVTVEKQASFLAEAVHVMGYDSVDVFGDWGGGSVGIELAVQHPDIVKHIFIPNLISMELEGEALNEMCLNYTPEIKLDKYGTHWTTAWNILRDQELYSPWFKSNKENIIHPEEEDISAEVIHRRTLDLFKSYDIYRSVYRAHFGYKVSQRISKINCPILIGQSSSDDVNSNIAKMNSNITIEKLSSERKTIVQSLIKFCQT